jgi:hypothetical protein
MEKKSFTAKDRAIKSTAKPEGREGTAPRVAYEEAAGNVGAVLMVSIEH